MVANSLMSTQNLIKVIFAGNIDDGKSSIIGRLFYDAGSLYEDQLRDLQIASDAYGKRHLDLSLFTDGLRSEREQGITIDVAYLYFCTSSMRFIILDTPGHKQYISNMVSAASQADIAVILFDVTKEISYATKWHLFICSEMGIRNVIIAFNKMDLVDFNEDFFLKRKQELENILPLFSFATVNCIPLSALQGDMVVERGTNLPWFKEDTLLKSLESFKTNVNVSTVQFFRFVVQGINRPHVREVLNFRGYNGQVLSGEIHVGKEVVVYPQGMKAKIKEIWMGSEKLTKACSPMSITLLLDREFDVSRGNIIATEDCPPKISSSFKARIFLFSTMSITMQQDFIFKILTSDSRGKIDQCYGEVDIENQNILNTTQFLEAFHFYDVKILLQDPIVYYQASSFPEGGRFILIDSQTFKTIAAGMIKGE